MNGDGDGIISAPEQSVSLVDKANPSPVDYDFRYQSYSVGANYRISQDAALFARASRGGHANANRLSFGKQGRPARPTRATRSAWSTNMKRAPSGADHIMGCL